MYPESCRIKRRWTVKEIGLLIDMTNRGMARRDICAALGREYEAIRTKQSQVDGDFFTVSSDPFAEVKSRWYEADRDGMYNKARQILGRRHRYDRRLGNFVDGHKVSVSEMLKMAGFKL